MEDVDEAQVRAMIADVATAARLLADTWEDAERYGSVDDEGWAAIERAEERFVRAEEKLSRLGTRP